MYVLIYLIVITIFIKAESSETSLKDDNIAQYNSEYNEKSGNKLGKDFEKILILGYKIHLIIVLVMK